MIQSPKLLARALPGLVSVSLLVLAAQPAAAVDVTRARISAPYEVANALQSLGLRPLGSPWQRGRFWVAPAVDRDGTRVRVIVEGGSGRIVNVREVEAAPPRPRRPIAGLPDTPGPRVVMRDGTIGDATPPRGDAWSDLDDEEYDGPRPRIAPAQPSPEPRAREQVRTRNPSERVAARPPASRPRTPLPKPRPEIAKAEPAPAPTAPSIPPEVEAKSIPPVAPLDPQRSKEKTEAFPPVQGLE
jgi:hypothetical protein